jgi:hypothetical protein
MRKVLVVFAVAAAALAGPADAAPTGVIRDGYVYGAEVDGRTISGIVTEASSGARAFLLIADRTAGTLEIAQGPANVAISMLADVAWAEGMIASEIVAWDPEQDEEGPVLGSGTISFSFRFRATGLPTPSGTCVCLLGSRTGIQRDATVSGTLASTSGVAATLDGWSAFLRSDVGL